VQRPSFKC